MALQQINWIQIDTENIPSGSQVTLASSVRPFEWVYTKNIFSSGALVVSGTIDTTGNVVIGGDLLVKGTTTSINSSNVIIDDNIIELNGSMGAYGGLLIKDPTNPNKISGSLLWDTLNDRWIGGPLGFEEQFIQETQFNNFSSSLLNLINELDSIWIRTGSYFATTNDLQVTGSMIIRGDLKVEGTTTLVQNLQPQLESLIVSGAMSVVNKYINNQVTSGSVSIEDLGTLSSRNDNRIIDLGGFF
jgi:hypothetical protein